MGSTPSHKCVRNDTVGKASVTQGGLVSPSGRYGWNRATLADEGREQGTQSPA